MTKDELVDELVETLIKDKLKSSRNSSESNKVEAKDARMTNADQVDVQITDKYDLEVLRLSFQNSVSEKIDNLVNSAVEIMGQNFDPEMLQDIYNMISLQNSIGAIDSIQSINSPAIVKLTDGIAMKRYNDNIENILANSGESSRSALDEVRELLDIDGKSKGGKNEFSLDVHLGKYFEADDMGYIHGLIEEMNKTNDTQSRAAYEMSATMDIMSALEYAQENPAIIKDVLDEIMEKSEYINAVMNSPTLFRRFIEYQKQYPQFFKTFEKNGVFDGNVFRETLSEKYKELESNLTKENDSNIGDIVNIVEDIDENPQLLQSMLEDIIQNVNDIDSILNDPSIRRKITACRDKYPGLFKDFEKDGIFSESTFIEVLQEKRKELQVDENIQDETQSTKSLEEIIEEGKTGFENTMDYLSMNANGEFAGVMFESLFSTYSIAKAVVNDPNLQEKLEQFISENKVRFGSYLDLNGKLDLSKFDTVILESEKEEPSKAEERVVEEVNEESSILEVARAEEETPEDDIGFGMTTKEKVDAATITIAAHFPLIAEEHDTETLEEMIGTVIGCRQYLYGEKKAKFDEFIGKSLKGIRDRTPWLFTGETVRGGQIDLDLLDGKLWDRKVNRDFQKSGKKDLFNDLIDTEPGVKNEVNRLKEMGPNSSKEEYISGINSLYGQVMAAHVSRIQFDPALIRFVSDVISSRKDLFSDFMRKNGTVDFNKLMLHLDKEHQTIYKYDPYLITGKYRDENGEMQYQSVDLKEMIIGLEDSYTAQKIQDGKISKNDVTKDNIGGHIQYLAEDLLSGVGSAVGVMSLEDRKQQEHYIDIVLDELDTASGKERYATDSFDNVKMLFDGIIQNVDKDRVPLNLIKKMSSINGQALEDVLQKNGINKANGYVIPKREIEGLDELDETKPEKPQKVQRSRKNKSFSEVVKNLLEESLNLKETSYAARLSRLSYLLNSQNISKDQKVEAINVIGIVNKRYKEDDLTRKGDNEPQSNQDVIYQKNRLIRSGVEFLIDSDVENQHDAVKNLMDVDEDMFKAILNQELNGLNEKKHINYEKISRINDLAKTRNEIIKGKEQKESTDPVLDAAKVEIGDINGETKLIKTSKEDDDEPTI